MLKLLYYFTSIHSFYMWMFSFFIPVYLFKQGFLLNEIFLFIALWWLTFTFSIYIWDYIRYKIWLKTVIVLSLIFELFLVSSLLLDKNTFFLITLAIIYGLTNCFFWLTNRVFFISGSEKNKIGNNFWNIQIIAFLVVKVWILVWWFFLSNDYIGLFVLLSFILTSIWIIFFTTNNKISKILKLFKNDKPVKIKNIFNFKDNLRSRITFILDGPYLFFESFLWVLTLFLISNENYNKLWLLVIALALSFSVFFVLIKKYIDKIDIKKLFYISVLIYSVWWFLRWYIWLDNNYYIILLIAFFTSFFRLTFNKNFFNIAKSTKTHDYVVTKSYYSQMSIFIFFIIMYFFYNYTIDDSHIYYVIWVFSLLFLLYKPLN